MTVVELDIVLPALERQSAQLVEHALDVFLEYDFSEHAILDGTLTGGHVVTYLAREADRMADQLLAAAGEIVPPPDRSRRWELTENGNLRPGAVLVDDIQVSSARLREAIAAIADWSTLDAAAREVPARRLLQLVVHLVDLGRPWEQLAGEDAAAAVSALPDVLTEELSAYRLEIDDAAGGMRWTTGEDTVRVAGPAWMLLAWASGRSDGTAGLPDELTAPATRVWM